jgi:hypothetical protein
MPKRLGNPAAADTLDCFAALAMTGCRARNDGLPRSQWRAAADALDCRAALAMTGCRARLFPRHLKVGVKGLD